MAQSEAEIFIIALETRSSPDFEIARDCEVCGRTNSYHSSAYVSYYIHLQHILDQHIDIRYVENMLKTTNARKQGAFLVLMALIDGPKHGYEIAKFIEAKSNSFFRMPFGTLYPVLHRLEKEGLLAESADEGNRGKKTYKLTPAGKKHAQSEVDEFQLFSRAMNRLVPG